jgi:hypothetical protein
MPYLIAGYALIWMLWIPLRFRTQRRGLRGLSAICKAAPTLWAACLAGWACLASGRADASAWLLFSGIAVGAAADAAMDYRFVAGGGLFFVGHGLYIAAFLLLDPPGIWNACFFAAVFGAALAFLWRFRESVPERRMRAGAALYAAALCAMLASAVPAAFLVGGRRAQMGAAGAALFALSDALLCINGAANRKERGREGAQEPRAKRRRTICSAVSLGCYYTAQTVLALSVFAGLAV